MFDISILNIQQRWYVVPPWPWPWEGLPGSFNRWTTGSFNRPGSGSFNRWTTVPCSTKWSSGLLSSKSSSEKRKRRRESAKRKSRRLHKRPHKRKSRRRRKEVEANFAARVGDAARVGEGRSKEVVFSCGPHSGRLRFRPLLGGRGRWSPQFPSLRGGAGTRRKEFLSLRGGAGTLPKEGLL